MTLTTPALPVAELEPSDPGLGTEPRRRGDGFTWWALPAQAAVLAVAVWVWWLFTDVLPAPGAMARAFSPAAALPVLIDGITSGAMIDDALASLWRLLVGLGLAVAIGVPLGLIIGASRPVRVASAGLVHLLRMTSPLSWAPIAVILFGVGHAPVMALVAVAAVWPIALATAAGVRVIDPDWLLLARSMGATPLERLRTIVLPAVRAPVLTGVRLALGVAWIVLVPAEMLGVDSGLGYAILNARDQIAYDQLMATILLIGIIGLALDLLAGALLRQRGR